MQAHVVGIEQSTRLDIWLSRKLGQSRSQIQKLIKSGAVLVNGKVKTPHFEVREGDIIDVQESERRDVHKVIDNEVRHEEKQEWDHTIHSTPCALVYECSDYLVVEKPEGIVVHHDAKHASGTLVDWVLARYPEIALVGDRKRPGIVHRLDKEVSGLIVVARTKAFYDCIRKQFEDREIKKEYIALVHGRVMNHSGVIEFNIARSKQKEKYVGLIVHSDDLDAKDAITHYEVIRANHHYSLLKLFPKTGRTHQLRVHMRTFGHPIAGDTLYALQKFRRLNQKFNRVCLHARSLAFTNMNGESVLYRSEVPDTMKNVVENIFHIQKF